MVRLVLDPVKVVGSFKEHGKRLIREGMGVTKTKDSDWNQN